MKKQSTRTKLYQVGIYLRLSREDGDKNESDSIQSQRRITMSYIEKNESMFLVSEYIDDGYSGTNFDRPDFKRMISDIQEGKINCVIVKDLSRFGRDYIGVGRYLEQIFVDYDVRFIAINDGVDSSNGEYDLIVPIKNIFNTQYAIDISKKVQSSFKAKQRSGEFVGAFASYGYRKSDTDRHRLIIDEYAAAIVRRIFDMFLGGMGKIAIAKALNDEGILCPSAYKRTSGLNYTNCNRLDKTTYWTYSSVCRILENQMYIGNMVQGKTKRRMKGPAKPVDKNDWIIVKGTHEPIIDMEKWDRVQTLLAKETRSPNFNQNISLFAGFLKCGDCGRAMCKKTHHQNLWYTCGSYTRYGKSVCSPHYITFSALEKIILDDISRIIASIEDLQSLIDDDFADSMDYQSYYEIEHSRLTNEIEKIKSQKLVLYGDFREQLISKQEYLLLREQYTERENLLTQKLEALEQTESPHSASVLDIPWVRHLLEYRDIQNVDREILADLIDVIYIFEDKRIQIVYNFDDELSALLDNHTQACSA